MLELKQRHCESSKQNLHALDAKAIEGYLTQLDDWHINNEGDTLYREFGFDDFHQTIAFVNALAWIANREDHHPDLEVGYNRCRVNYTTHSVGGLSVNDFICAARIDALDS